MIAGPRTRAPAGSRSRSYSPAVRGLVCEVTQLEPAIGLGLERGAELLGPVLDLLGRDDELDAVADALDRHVLEAIPVAALVLGVEAADQLGNRLLRDRPLGHLDERRLPALPQEAPVEAAPDGDAVLPDAGPLAQPPLHVLEDRRDHRCRLRREHDVGAAAVVVDEVGAQEAEGGEEPRVGRDDEPLHAQQLERRGKQHRPGGAVGDEA